MPNPPICETLHLDQRKLPAEVFERISRRARFQIHADTGSFQRSTTFVHLRKIIPQHRHVGYFTTRMETFRHSNQAAVTSHSG